MIAFGAGAWMWRRRRRFLELSADRLVAWQSSLARGGLRVLAATMGVIVLAVSIIGLPIAAVGLLMLVALWMTGQIVVAAFIAQRLPSARWSFDARLLVALVALAILSLPGWGIGATLSALMSVAGIGSLAFAISPVRPIGSQKS